MATHREMLRATRPSIGLTAEQAEQMGVHIKEKTMATYEHLGRTIIFDEKSGRFRTMIGRSMSVFPSLDAAKRAIDSDVKRTESFERVRALREHRYGEQLSKGQSKFRVRGAKFISEDIVGIQPVRGRESWRNRAAFIFAGGKHEERMLPDTPENRAAYKKLMDYRFESDRIKRERDAEEQRLLAKVQQFNVEEWLAHQKKSAKLKSRGRS